MSQTEQVYQLRKRLRVGTRIWISLLDKTKWKQHKSQNSDQVNT